MPSNQLSNVLITITVCKSNSDKLQKSSGQTSRSADLSGLMQSSESITVSRCVGHRDHTSCYIYLCTFLLGSESHMLSFWSFYSLTHLILYFICVLLLRVDSDRNGQITSYELGKALSNGRCCVILLVTILYCYNARYVLW